MGNAIGLTTPSENNSEPSSGVIRSSNSTVSSGYSETFQVQSGYGALVSATEGNGTYGSCATIICPAGKSMRAGLSGGSFYINVSVSQSGTVRVTCTFTGQYIEGWDEPAIAVIPLTPD